MNQWATRKAISYLLLWPLKVSWSRLQCLWHTWFKNQILLFVKCASLQRRKWSKDARMQMWRVDPKTSIRGLLFSLRIKSDCLCYHQMTVFILSASVSAQLPRPSVRPKRRDRVLHSPALSPPTTCANIRLFIKAIKWRLRLDTTPHEASQRSVLIYFYH